MDTPPKTALVAEANLRLAHRIAEELQAIGLACDFAKDGLQALQQLAKADYALLVVDLVLPQVSGAELARKIRKSPRGARLPIEIISPPLKDPAVVDKMIAEMALGPYFKMPFSFGFFRQMTQGYLAKGTGGLSAVEQHRISAESAARAAPAPAPAPPLAAASPPPSPSPSAPAAASPAAAAAPKAPATPQAAPPPPAKPGPTSSGADPWQAPGGPPPQTKTLTWGSGQMLQSFDQMLLQLKSEEFTGRLRCEGGGSLKVFTFAQGLPVDASVLHPSRSFAESFAPSKEFSPAEKNALKEKAQRQSDAFVLVQMGALPWPDLLAERSRFVAKELAECFGWGGGQGALESAADGLALPFARTIGLPTLALAFLEGGRILAANAQALTQLETQLAGKFLSKTPAFYDYAHILASAPEETGLLTQISGKKSFSQVLTHAQDRKAWTRLAWVLLLLGMVQMNSSAREDAPAPFPLRPLTPPKPAAPAPAQKATPPGMEIISISEDPHAEPPPKAAAQADDGMEVIDIGSDLLEELDAAVDQIRGTASAGAPAAPSGDRKLEDELIDELERIKKSDYYQMFGSRSSAFKFQEVKKAYFDLQRKYSPDKFVMSPAEIMSKCEEFLDRVSKAFETLSDVQKKLAYDEQLNKKKMLQADKESGGGLQASVSFESGRALIKEKDFAGAEREIRTAMHLAPGNVEHDAYLAWILYKNPKNQKDMGAQVRARQMLDQTLVKSPRLAIAYAFRGSVFMDQGKLDLAFTDLAKALKFDPACLHAKQEMRRLEDLRQQK